MQAIVVIIALVFIFWGVGTQMMNRNHSAITVNGEEISFQQYQKAYEKALSQLRERFNGVVPQGFAEKIGLKQQVISRFIREVLFQQGGQQMGLIVSPAEVQNEIQNMAVFQDNGTFSLPKYKLLLSRNGFSAHGFEDSIRHDMLTQKTINAIEKFAAIVTDHEIKSLYDLEQESVAVSFAKISPAAFTDKVHVTDTDLAAWYATVKDQYKTLPQIQLQYLSFDFDKLARTITVDDDAVRDYYSKNSEKFTTPEQRRARHILFKVESDSPAAVAEAQRKKAEEVLKLARSGKDFAQLAKQYSQGPSAKNGGDLGFFQKGQMVESFDNAVFSMKPGQISDIIRSPFGYHIIKLEAIKPAVVKALSQVHDEIVQDIRLSRAKAIAFKKANDCYEGIIGDGSLQAYTKKHPEASVIETGFFTRQSPPEALKGDTKFLTAAFALKQGELSSLIETKNGYAIIFAEHIKEPTIPALTDIKERVSKDFIAAKAEEMAKKSAEDLLEKAKTGGDFAQLIQAAGATLETSGLLSKVHQDPKSPFPSSLVNQIFELSAKSPYPVQVGQADKQYYVYKFAQRIIPKMELSATEREQYKGALSQLKEQELLNAWLAHARKQATITTYKGL